MFVALFFAFKPYFNGFEMNAEKADLIFKNLNNVLIFMGLGISFSTLQDTTKTQNKMSRKVWENPKKGKLAILLISLLTLSFILIGLTGYFSTNENKLKELSIGIIIFGIGLIGLLKAAIEMFENHRKDKNDAVHTA
jgi:protein-S-isoprenylcysteine O-methyltransferase Ste14